jgi:TRAP transporter TAXI family solute receptor
MKRTCNTLLILPIFLLVLLLASCGGTDDGGASPTAGGETADGEASAPSGSTRFLSVGTAPTGGAFFPVGGALAGVAQEFGPAGWQVTAEATQGSRENIRRLAQGELDFALSNAAITYFAVRGDSVWDEPQEMRAVMTLAPNVAFFVTTEGSGIRRVGDLVGKRVVIGPAGAGFEDFVEPIVSNHDINYDDFTLLNGPQGAAVNMLADGSADAAFLGGAVPTASLVQASTSMDLFFIPFDDAAREELLADYPFYSPATVPAGTYRGQETDYVGLNVGSMHLITAVSVDEDIVYAFTKAIYENAAAVVERHPAGKAIQAKNVVRDTGTEFHQGAIRYYQEIDIWDD